ncbi:DMT family transporter [Kurthia gibsonii]|uniref:DMT family transporter n=1 Tax=Kurthia TaxID=1649 RepID=UPI000745C98A|nr:MULTISPECIES: DMT family transporter [unclassified Kurthia]AMA62605.1 eamA-like transporter family protein [Kurthia sp. 11kri321]WIL38374.1 DMT family transporter [Kurthia sp. YJT4]
MNMQAAIQLTISMAIFGSVGFFTIQTGIPAEELVFVRCICATLFLGGLWLITKSYKTEQWSRKEVIQTIICGVFLVFNWVFLFKAFNEMEISLAISIYNLAPIFVLILGGIFLKERLTIPAILAIVVCFLGSILIVGVQQVDSLHLLWNEGFIYAMLSAICYAMTMFVGRGVKHLSTYALTFVQTIVGIVILFPMVQFDVFHGLTTSNWLYILGTGFIHTGFVYYLFFNSIRNLSTLLVSALVFVDPLVAILLDIWILDFRPTMTQILGMLFIFGGIIYTVIKPPKKENITKEVAS